MFGKYRNIDDYIMSVKHLYDYENQYDEIYPMHGTFPVKKDLIDIWLLHIASKPYSAYQVYSK